jgi:DNA-binding response OmpR family regulator
VQSDLARRVDACRQRGPPDAIGSLRVYIAGLRKKLGDAPSQPRMITTEPGVGYRLRADD